MRSLFTKIILAMSLVMTLSLTMIIVNADNTQLITTNKEVEDVCKSIEESGMKDNLAETNLLSDGEVISKEKTSLGTSKIEFEYDIHNTVKIYQIKNVQDIGTVQKKSDYIVPVKQGKNIVALVTMKRGCSLEKIKPNLDKLDISDEQRNEMVKRITEREGKWFAAYMEEITPEISDIFSYDSLIKYVDKLGVKDVEEIEYFRIHDTFLLRVKTTSEYEIIPVQLSTRGIGKLESKPYNEKELAAVINDR